MSDTTKQSNIYEAIGFGVFSGFVVIGSVRLVIYLGLPMSVGEAITVSVLGVLLGYLTPIPE